MTCPRCGGVIEDRTARHQTPTGRDCFYLEPFPWPTPKPECDDPRHAPCGDCGGEILVGSDVTIRVPRLDPDGFPIIDTETGEMLSIHLPLPVHVNPWVHSKFVPS